MDDISSPKHPAIRLDPAFVALAILVAAAATMVPPIFRGAVIAIAIALVVLAPMPRGTRGMTFAVMIGLATGIGSVALFAVGIFQLPITREFGWTQAQYSLVTPLTTIVTVTTSLAIGRLFDRRGVRRFALACTLLLGLMLISLYWLTNSLWHFYGVFLLVPILGAGTSSIAYSRVVARWFNERRGQAFGAALAGVGIGAAVLSAVSQYLIGRVGWRGAYVGLGLLVICVTLPIVYFWLRDAPEDVGLAQDGVPLASGAGGAEDARAARGAGALAAPSRLLGPSAPDTRRLRRFWRMLAALLVLGFAIGGVMLQFVPILRARGIAPEQAAAIQGALGLALIVGRAFAGYLMDRMFAPYVAAVITMFPLAGAALLASGVSGGGATVAAVCLGLAAGAELDVIAYLCSRYFGTRAYAENYGWFYATWTLGSGTAPLLTAMSYDRLGTHSPILWFYVLLFAVAAVMIARLGPYPVLEPAEPAEPAAVA